MKRKYSVSYAQTPSEKMPVHDFVRSVYEPKYGTFPGIANIYAVVRSNDKLLACMGVDLPQNDGRFQIECTYGILRERLPLPVTNINTVALAKWASLDPGAGMIAVFAAVMFSRKMERLYGFAEHDDEVHLHTQRSLGVLFWNIEHSPANPEALPSEHREFYSKNLMRPYLIDLEQVRLSLQCRIRRYAIEGL